MVFLCLLVKHKFLQLYDPTYQKVFEPLLNALETLQKGIYITVNGSQKVKLIAKLQVILEDNLSSHALAGFQTLFNSGSICRFCTIKYSDFRKTIVISELRERSKEVYHHQIKYIDEDPNDAALYGLKSRCTFSKLDYFSVTDAFPSDIMHDCLEGVIPVTVFYVLKALHSQNIINVNSLNTVLSQLKCPGSDKPNRFSDNFF